MVCCPTCNARPLGPPPALCSPRSHRILRQRRRCPREGRRGARRGLRIDVQLCTQRRARGLHLREQRHAQASAGRLRASCLSGRTRFARATGGRRLVGRAKEGLHVGGRRRALRGRVVACGRLGGSLRYISCDVRVIRERAGLGRRRVRSASVVARSAGDRTRVPLEAQQRGDSRACGGRIPRQARVVTAVAVGRSAQMPSAPSRRLPFVRSRRCGQEGGCGRHGPIHFPSLRLWPSPGRPCRPRGPGCRDNQ